MSDTENCSKAADGGLHLTSCCASWILGDKPATPQGSSVLMWVTMRRKDNGKLSVGVLTYHNGHVMPCSDQCDPPECAVPHNPEEDGYCEEYEWTCWSDGYCEHCETEWVWSSHYVEIIAHAPVSKPKPFLHNVKAHPPLGARADVDHWVDVVITGSHGNRTAPSGWMMRLVRLTIFLS